MFKKIKKYMLKQAIKCLGHKDPYPETVKEILDDNIKYKDDLIQVMESFKRSNPWKQQEEKFKNLNIALAQLYDITVPLLIFTNDRPSCYIPFVHTIFLCTERDGKYSVITYLHEFGHAIGKNEKNTCRWSINLFRKIFPNSYDKLVPHKHMLYKKDL